MAQVDWSRAAQSDVRAIAAHIAKDSHVYAERMVDRLYASTKRLERSPLSGQMVPEIGREQIREVQCWPFRVLYVVEGNNCIVAAVIHGSRDFVSALPADRFKPE